MSTPYNCSVIVPNVERRCYYKLTNYDKRGGIGAYLNRIIGFLCTHRTTSRVGRRWLCTRKLCANGLHYVR